MIRTVKYNPWLCSKQPRRPLFIPIFHFTIGFCYPDQHDSVFNLVVSGESCGTYAWMRGDARCNRMACEKIGSASRVSAPWEIPSASRWAPRSRAGPTWEKGHRHSFPVTRKREDHPLTWRVVVAVLLCSACVPKINAKFFSMKRRWCFLSCLRSLHSYHRLFQPYFFCVPEILAFVNPEVRGAY